MGADETAEEIEIRIGDHLSLKVRAAERLMYVCDRHATPIGFGCRAASCGTCAIRVVRGMENLSPLNEKESIVIDDVADGRSDVRLACQVRVFGPVHLEPLGSAGEPE